MSSIVPYYRQHFLANVHSKLTVVKCQATGDSILLRVAITSGIEQNDDDGRQDLRYMVWYGIVEFNVPLDTV